MKLLRQIARLFAFLGLTAVIPTAQGLFRWVKPSDPYRIARLYHRMGVRALGVRVHVEGAPATGKVVFAANHVSHLDISVLGGAAPGRFISKKEVKNWPLFGQLAGLQDTLFVDRSPALSAIRATRATVQQALDEGSNLIIFPEGTNTIGNVVLPFRRAMLDGLKAPGYQMQPVAIVCTHVNGKPVQRVEDFEAYGWGDISFAAHFWRVLGYRNMDVSVTFLPAMPAGSGDKIEGKTIEQCGDAVRALVEKTILPVSDYGNAPVAQQDRATVS